MHNGYLSQCIQRQQFTDAKHERVDAGNELDARNEGIGALPAECIDHISIILFFLLPKNGGK